MTHLDENPTSATPEMEATIQEAAPEQAPKSAPETPAEIEAGIEAGIETEMETPEASIAQLKAFLAEAEERTTRLLADFDNFRKRTQREKEDLSRHVTENVLKALLNVFDDIDRAKEAADKSDNLEKLREGFQGVYKNFLNTLEKLGVRRMEVVGQPFDSEVHEAIGAIPVEDEAQKGTVVNVLKHGYLYNERVLRIAQVLTGE